MQYIFYTYLYDIFWRPWQWLAMCVGQGVLHHMSQNCEVGESNDPSIATYWTAAKHSHGENMPYLVGGFKHFLFSISYMGCHPSHWRTHIF